MTGQGQHRPLVALPARFSTGATALRYAAEVAARALVAAVFRAGGEPWLVHPHAPGGTADATEVAARLSRCDGLLLPGGGDVAPHRYASTEVHESVYDTDDEQDGFDLAAARYALDAGLPVLAVCRGLQVVNVALGGSLHQHAAVHRHLVHPVNLAPGSRLAAICGAPSVAASCYHHQAVDRLGAGLRAAAWAADGTVEALELEPARGWFAAVQWHPEDTAAQDPANQRLFDALVTASRDRR
ncbi:MAG TPA: gamma-glutamyl-gamma-aminobutyrate hydrolase family protein [Rugosimonospora sp.]|nr:gamma-glutamyl-gamma-aminobutyrate hydrolase family protein [Rugosimonospora sp.]